MTFGIHIDSKVVFFDRAVKNRADRATNKALGKSLAFLRRRWRSSIRKTKKSATPGNPPRAHTSDQVVSIKNIRFGREEAGNRIVGGVVGPVLLRGRGRTNWRSSQPSPALLEFGGAARAKEYQRWPGGPWRTLVGKRRAPAGSNTRWRRLRYNKFPSAIPARDAEVAAGTLPREWVKSWGDG